MTLNWPEGGLQQITATVHLIDLASRQGHARERKILLWFQFDLGRPVPLAKIFAFSFDPNHFTVLRIPAQHRGAFRDRHERGVGMRWTRQRRSANILRGRTALMRTVKPCGPDAPTLASSWRKPFPLAMVARKPGHQGERGGNRKTIAQEAPGVPVCLW